MKTVINKEYLVGKFFHSFSKNGGYEWQGHILSSEKDSYYLVQLCDWITGQESIIKLVHISKMILWNFYHDNEQMNFYYQSHPTE